MCLSFPFGIGGGGGGGVTWNVIVLILDLCCSIYFEYVFLSSVESKVVKFPNL